MASLTATPEISVNRSAVMPDTHDMIAMGRRMREEDGMALATQINLKAGVELPKNCMPGEACHFTLFVENKGTVPVLSPILSAVALGLPGGASATTKTTGWTCGYADPNLTCATTGITLQPGQSGRFVLDWMLPEVKATTVAKVCYHLVWAARPKDGIYRTDQIAAVQYALRRAGFDTGGIDGRIHPKTLEAIRKLRQIVGLQGPAEVTPDLLNNLFGASGYLQGDTDPSDDQACGEIEIRPAEKKVIVATPAAAPQSPPPAKPEEPAAKLAPPVVAQNEKPTAKPAPQKSEDRIPASPAAPPPVAAIKPAVPATPPPAPEVAKPAEQKPAEPKTVEQKPVEQKPAVLAPAQEIKKAEPKPATPPAAQAETKVAKNAPAPVAPPAVSAPQAKTPPAPAEAPKMALHEAKKTRHKLASNVITSDEFYYPRSVFHPRTGQPQFVIIHRADADFEAPGPQAAGPGEAGAPAKQKEAAAKGKKHAAKHEKLIRSYGGTYAYIPRGSEIVAGYPYN